MASSPYSRVRLTECWLGSLETGLRILQADKQHKPQPAYKGSQLHSVATAPGAGTYTRVHQVNMQTAAGHARVRRRVRSVGNRSLMSTKGQLAMESLSKRSQDRHKCPAVQSWMSSWVKLLCVMTPSNLCTGCAGALPNPKWCRKPPRPGASTCGTWPSSSFIQAGGKTCAWQAACWPQARLAAKRCQHPRRPRDTETHEMNERLWA